MKPRSPLSPSELSRRVESAVAAARNGAAHQNEMIIVGGALSGGIGAPTIDQMEPVAVQAPTRSRFEPDFPVVTITLDGPASSGKSVIAHVIRNALAREGFACSGPEGLRSLPWRRALEHLLMRGLRVELQRGDDGVPAAETVTSN